MNILIVGNGMLAMALRGHFALSKISMHSPDETKFDVVLHVGSGREMDFVHQLCSKCEIPLIQGSTGLKVPKSEHLKYAYILAPNFALPIIRFISTTLPAIKKAHGPKATYGLIESHQATKKTVAGTALKMAEILDMNSQHITSIRDEASQLKMGIPRHHLGRHAVHQIQVHDGQIVFNYETRVYGLDPYLVGAAEICKAVYDFKSNIFYKPGIHQVSQIVD